MKKGDEIRRKDNHSVIARVNNVRRKFIPGYGLVTEVEIFNGMGMSWVPMKPWEVIKGDQNESDRNEYQC